MGVKPQPWNPTVRRGPIAAEMKSPAPNSVDLPPLLGLFYFRNVQVYGQNECLFRFLFSQYSS